MNQFTHRMGACLFAGLLAFASADASAQSAPELDAWLKAAQLGPYDTGTEDWAEIERKAKAEGEVIVYSSSSRVAKVADAFMAIYPEIKITSHDLGSVQSVEKTVREQNAGLYNADIVTTGGSGQVIHEMLNKQRIFNYVPAHYKSRIPKENQDPLLIRVNEAVSVLYNAEAHPDTPPVKNLWEFTEPQWKGKVGMKNPLSSLSTFMGVATIAQHGDEMAAAYKRHTGKDIELGEGVPSAGYEFWGRMLRNDMVIFKSGSKLAGAAGKKGQKNPLVAITNMTHIAYNDSKGYINRLTIDLDPVAKVIYPTYTAIARQAPHPNAAKFFTAYLLGSTELTTSSKLEKPYTEGKSLELLQGLAPYFDPGSVSPRSDVPFPQGGEAWGQMKAWTVDPDFMWSEGPKVRDFWIVEAGG
jgi:iron(III) transport system substrate-binding protein